VVGEAAVSAARTDTFLGERYRRIARRRGKKRAIVAVGRSILVIIWALLSDGEAQFIDLDPDVLVTGVLRGPRGDRTHNPRIKSPLLCQLS
jgi:hypothetical protein